MKSSIMQATHTGMIMGNARFHLPEVSQVWPLKSKLKSYEIEYD